MRFGVYILTLCLILFAGQGSASAQNRTQIETEFSNSPYTDLTRTSEMPPARFQKGQQADKITTLDSLEAHRFARRLGEISAIARGAKGQLYTADRQTGRIFILSDYNQDGRTEQIQPLAHRFNAPSAVMELDNTLYVADRDAIWSIDLTALPASKSTQLASLKNIMSAGPYFLTTGQSNIKETGTKKTETILLGYSADDNTAKLISVHIHTGQAEFIAATDGTLEQLAAGPNSKPWMIYRHQDTLNIGTAFDNTDALKGDFSVTGLALPSKDIAPDNWPESLEDHILISRTNPVAVTALPTSLSRVLPMGRDIFTGFQNGRTAWGKAGVLHMDKRGLFIADPYNGDLWRLAPKQTPEDTASDSPLKLALEKLKIVKEEAEKPLEKNPLDGIYDSHFPDPNATKPAPPKGPQKPAARPIP